MLALRSNPVQCLNTLHCSLGKREYAFLGVESQRQRVKLSKENIPMSKRKLLRLGQISQSSILILHPCICVYVG